jgi:hypothetical protein
MGSTCNPSPLGFHTVHFGPGRTLKGILPCEVREFEGFYDKAACKWGLKYGDFLHTSTGDLNMQTFAHLFSKKILCTLAIGLIYFFV